MDEIEIVRQMSDEELFKTYRYMSERVDILTAEMTVRNLNLTTGTRS